MLSLAHLLCNQLSLCSQLSCSVKLKKTITNYQRYAVLSKISSDQPKFRLVCGLAENECKYFKDYCAQSSLVTHECCAQGLSVQQFWRERTTSLVISVFRQLCSSSAKASTGSTCDKKQNITSSRAVSALKQNLVLRSQKMEHW